MSIFKRISRPPNIAEILTEICVTIIYYIIKMPHISHLNPLITYRCDYPYRAVCILVGHTGSVVRSACRAGRYTLQVLTYKPYVV